MAATFRIITTGRPVAGGDGGQVLQRLAKLLTSEQRARMLLSGSRRVIKSGLSRAAAEKYSRALGAAGLAVAVEPEATAGGATPAMPPKATGPAPAPGPDLHRMLARLRMSVHQVGREIGREIGHWVGCVVTLLCGVGVTALAWSQMAWYWAIGMGMAAAMVPAGIWGASLERSEKAAVDRFVGLLTAGAAPGAEWPALVQACLRQNEIHFQAFMGYALPKRLDAWCQAHWSPEAEAMVPGFEFHLTGKRALSAAAQVAPAAAEPGSPPPPEVEAVATAPQAATDAPAPVRHASPPVPARVALAPRNAPPSAKPALAPQSPAKPASPDEGGQAAPPRTEPPAHRPPRTRPVPARSPGLLGNLLGMVCGGIVFGLTSVLIVSLTGLETIGMIAAAVMGLSAWRGVAAKFER